MFGIIWCNKPSELTAGMHDQQLIIATGILYHNTDADLYRRRCHRHNCIGRNIDEELAGSSTREIAAASQNPTAIIPTTGVSSRNVALLCLLFFLSVIYRQVKAKYSTKTIGVVLSPYLSTMSFDYTFTNEQA